MSSSPTSNFILKNGGTGGGGGIDDNHQQFHHSQSGSTLSSSTTTSSLVVVHNRAGGRRSSSRSRYLLACCLPRSSRQLLLTTFLAALLLLNLSFVTYLILFCTVNNDNILAAKQYISHGFGTVDGGDDNKKFTQTATAAAHGPAAACSDEPNFNTKSLTLAGSLYHENSENPHPQFGLTIGIPSINRPDETNYLHETLQSIFDELPHDKYEVRVNVLVLLAHADAIERDTANELLKIRFSQQISTGLLHVIRRPELVAGDTFDPCLFPAVEKNYSVSHDDNIRQDENVDGVIMGRWRAHQTLDFAFLWNYAAKFYAHNPYYLQLEDDVTAGSDFVEHVRNSIQSVEGGKTRSLNSTTTNAPPPVILNNVVPPKRKWALIEFAQLGFIGKLFHTEQLPKLANLARLFLRDIPVDWLLIPWRNLMLQPQPFMHMAGSLFQHRGKVSSLPGRVQDLQEALFVGGSESSKMRFAGDNPPAYLHTDLLGHDASPLVQSVYAPLLGARSPFWFKPAKKGNSITIGFMRPVRLKKVIIDSGVKSSKNMLVGDFGIVMSAEPGVLAGREQLQANELIKVCTFNATGMCFNDELDKAYTFQVSQLRIRIEHDYDYDGVINEIAIFLHVNDTNMATFLNRRKAYNSMVEAAVVKNMDFML